jgi:hypothetical protein
LCGFKLKNQSCLQFVYLRFVSDGFVKFEPAKHSSYSLQLYFFCGFVQFEPAKHSSYSIQLYFWLRVRTVRTRQTQFLQSPIVLFPRVRTIRTRKTQFSQSPIVLLFAGSYSSKPQNTVLIVFNCTFICGFVQFEPTKRSSYSLQGLFFAGVYSSNPQNTVRTIGRYFYSRVRTVQTRKTQFLQSPCTYFCGFVQFEPKKCSSYSLQLYFYLRVRTVRTRKTQFI